MQINITPSCRLNTTASRTREPNIAQAAEKWAAAPLGNSYAERQQGAGTSRIASPRNLPVHEPESIDIGALEGVKVLHVDGFIKDFRSHVSGTARGTQ